MVRTPWLLATLLFASLMILVIMGPFEVLIPFLIKDRLGGGPGDHAMVLAAFGIGGAVGSLAMASFRMPRRYLTLMNLMWGVGCLPLLVIGFATEVWQVVVAAFVLGASVLGADGHLGDAAAAPGAAAHAGPGRLARLLRLGQPDAGLDGAGRAGVRGDRPAHDVRHRRPSCRAWSLSSRSCGPSCRRTRSRTRSRRRAESEEPERVEAVEVDPFGRSGRRSSIADRVTRRSPRFRTSAIASAALRPSALVSAR